MNAKELGVMPAMPMPIAGCPDGSVYNTMEQSGGTLGGMTIRQRFAMAAMEALIGTAAAPCMGGLDGFEPHLAKAAYGMADAMLEHECAELAKDQP